MAQFTTPCHRAPVSPTTEKYSTRNVVLTDFYTTADLTKKVFFLSFRLQINLHKQLIQRTSNKRERRRSKI